MTRYIWAEYLEEADHLRHTLENKQLYAKQKETIERVFQTPFHTQMPRLLMQPEAFVDSLKRWTSSIAFFFMD
ncbi:hypothetical protein [Paenibacillus zanthoxyli]|uniref:hypothetical protein n=1 Tax=Paenibacillus zanthoxyli TaxID=369399 RepID=UPI00046E9A5B|nr:hypothetical protein [Paenibacillus zanthoxyli]